MMDEYVAMAECRQGEETEIFGESLPQCCFVHRRLFLASAVQKAPTMPVRMRADRCIGSRCCNRKH
jgi:hypothetical protein